MGRIGRSFQLVGHSYRILMQDKELMVLPLVSGAMIAGVLATIGFGLGPGAFKSTGPGFPTFFLAYIAAYAISIFFQAAVVAGATERMRGGDPTLRSALTAAGRRIGPILLWAVLSGTVGVIIRLIQERVPLAGRLIARLVGSAWSMATLFVVPVLVLEDRSPRESFSRSLRVFKRTWGETVVGGVNLGVAAMCAWVTLVALVGLLTYVIGLGALVLFFAGAAVLMVFFSALQGIYVASLYRYATEGAEASGFDSRLLEQAFVAKR